MNFGDGSGVMCEAQSLGELKSQGFIRWRILRYRRIFSYPDPDLKSPCPYLSVTMLIYAHIQPYPRIWWHP